jgi:hypothetical protein
VAWQFLSKRTIGREDSCLRDARSAVPVAVATGLPDFSLYKNTKTGKNVPNDYEIYQMDVKYTTWPQNIPNDHNTYQHFPFQGPRKYTQVANFGMKIYHLATLSRHIVSFLSAIVNTGSSSFMFYKCAINKAHLCVLK